DLGIAAIEARMTLIVEIEGVGGDGIGAAPDQHLLVAVLGRGFRLVQPLQRAVVALVQAPAQADGGVHGVHFVQRDPEGADGALQNRAECQVKFVAFLFEQLARLARLFAPRFGEVDIGPAGETVFKVPLALAVAHQDDLIHGKSHLEVNNLRPFYNRQIMPITPAFFRNESWTFSLIRPTCFSSSLPSLLRSLWPCPASCSGAPSRLV